MLKDIVIKSLSPRKKITRSQADINSLKEVLALTGKTEDSIKWITLYRKFTFDDQDFESWTVNDQTTKEVDIPDVDKVLASGKSHLIVVDKNSLGVKNELDVIRIPFGKSSCFEIILK